ncbi:MAG: hypothetical protein SPD91_04985 [Streptococcus hyointestinalis]|uniref:Hypothetical cytosolic protein n=1 Tax=Streptococcus hyointestinalis TaxID=1337 RepID=A0A380K737_9STRE|nr:hypothetical protein [Streptococcus hyointestinalis]MCI6872233.1 hypothetical protein [Streptococcus hyointestinalis]MDD7357218.1 hypothetical protein [Streptococcus hyointestinalis]MDY4553807.1 hypothetical protein [Streptococcus hyointestinalis]SUN60464.1 hypothetical cytosolic protein [Streptococcus hyointestinalis]
MNEFEAFKKTLSQESLTDIYNETKTEVTEDYLEGTEAFSVALATQMAVNLVEKYHEWLKEK